MPVTIRPRVVWTFLASVSAVLLSSYAYRTWAQEPGRARVDGGSTGTADAARLKPANSLILPAFGGFGGGARPEAESNRPAVVYVQPPVTAKAARTWEKLQRPVAFNFPQETPFQDVLKYLKQVTQTPPDKGLTFYVDPVGLQEAEKTLTSPVTIEIDEVSIATGLQLVLKQLGLTFHVHPEGMVMIDVEDDEGPVTDPAVRILDEVAELRAELSEIRTLLGAGRGQEGASRERQVGEILEQLDVIRRAVTPSGGQGRSTRPQQGKAAPEGGARP